MRKPKAVALYSGGLDSTLAIIVMVSHGVEVEALHFYTDLVPEHYQSDFHKRLKADSEKFGFSHTGIHLGEKFYDIIRNPVHGYGKNVNPCIDCKILMLREAGDYINKYGYDFIITGEVVGQRPMSQMRQTLYMIENRADVENMVVRPLSGRILEPTIAEDKGLVKREWMLAINGRSRKDQLELAEKFGVEDYSSPAGGCLLTDPNYAARVKDMMKFKIPMTENEMFLLRLGRQFRLTNRCKLVVGRDEPDNDAIEELVLPDDFVLEVKDAGSPVAILRGEITENEIAVAASIVAGYSSVKRDDHVGVDIDRGDIKSKVTVAPAGQDVRERYIIR